KLVIIPVNPSFLEMVWITIILPEKRISLCIYFWIFMSFATPSNLKKDLYYPTEDYTSIFLLHKLLKLLGSKGAKNLYFSEPILDTNGLLQVNNTTPLDIWDISNNELIITGEDNEYAFMSIYDSFTTLLLAKEENIEYIVQSMNVEAVICDKKTMIDWYF
ncbi:DUF2711 family protein, partial [Bacillus thuringiensis]|uniref:DUF2711 family protein n=1 Tax=Bacillus thuringiensis TaxID=1428 RepID=UPI00345875CC